MPEPLGQKEPKEPQLPDPAICRALRVLPNLVECLVVKPRPHVCPHATPFGSGIFCKHPDREQIIARTIAEKKKESGNR